MCIRSMSGNRESSEETVMRSHRQSSWGRQGRNPSMCASEQSDRPIVPEKPSNNVLSTGGYSGHGAAEMVEGRGLTKGNLLKFDRCRTQ